MNGRFYRWADMAGIGFVVLLVVGALMAFTSQPNFKKHDSPATIAEKIFKVYHSSGDRAVIIIGAYLMVLSALALIWFAVGLRGRLVAAGHSPEAGRLVLGFAGLGAVAISVSALAMATISGSYVFGNEPLPTNADAIRVIDDLGPGVLLVIFGLSAAALIATVTIVDWKGGLLPRWLSRAGIIGVLAAVLAVVFVPLILVMAWFLAVAIVGLRRGTSKTSEQGPTATGSTSAPATGQDVPPTA
jgi:hypothetical protein